MYPTNIVIIPGFHEPNKRNLKKKIQNIISNTTVKNFNTLSFVLRDDLNLTNYTLMHFFEIKSREDK